MCASCKRLIFERYGVVRSIAGVTFIRAWGRKNVVKRRDRTSESVNERIRDPQTSPVESGISSHAYTVQTGPLRKIWFFSRIPRKTRAIANGRFLHGIVAFAGSAPFVRSCPFFTNVMHVRPGRCPNAYSHDAGNMLRAVYASLCIPIFKGNGIMELPISVHANIYSRGYLVYVIISGMTCRWRLAPWGLDSRVSSTEGDDYFKETPEATVSLFPHKLASSLYKGNVPIA